MPKSANAGLAKLAIRWSRGAQASFSSTLERIRSQDPGTEALVLQRVDRALAVLVLQPGLGTPILGTATMRRFAIPNTGHFVDYRVVGGNLVISNWMRQTRRRKH